MVIQRGVLFKEDYQCNILHMFLDSIIHSKTFSYFGHTNFRDHVFDLNDIYNLKKEALDFLKHH